MISPDVVPGEVFACLAQTLPARRRPKHRDSWSPAERRLEHTLPAPQGRRVARAAEWSVIEVKR